MITIVEANKIIKDFQEQAPVDVLKIAQALGLRVYKYSKWPDDISGMIKKDKEIGGNAGFAIFVNANAYRCTHRSCTNSLIDFSILHPTTPIYCPLPLENPICGSGTKRNICVVELKLT